MVKPIPSSNTPKPQPIEETDKKEDPANSKISGQKAGRTITNTNPASTPGIESDSELEPRAIKNRMIEVLLSDKIEKVQFSSLDELGSAVKSLYEGNNLTQRLRSKLDMQRVELFEKENIPHYNVMIAGAGPAGLMAAIDQAEQGRSVCLLEGRNQDDWDIRSSVMALSNKISNNILHMLTELEPVIGSEHVFSHKAKSNEERPKSLNRLKNELEEDVNNDDGSLLQTDVIQRICVAYAKIKYPFLIDIEHQAVADNFDPWLQTMNLTSSGTVGFDSIIHADGAHGKSRASLAELGVVSEYNASPAGMKERSQCAYLYHPSWTKVMEYGGVLDGGQEIPSDLLPRFREFGWNKDKLPATYMFLSHSESEKIWVAGRCPEALQPEQQLEWNKLLCEAAVEPAGRAVLEDPIYIETDSDTGRGRKKAKLSHVIFTVEQRELQNPSVDLPFGKSEAIGDARKAPDFLLGEGIGNAARNIKNLCISKPYRNELNDNNRE